MNCIGRICRLIAVLGSAALVLSALAGCAGIRLYSETRDKQGQAAAAAWKQVDLTGFFAAERENRAKLLEEELATSDRLVVANRDVALRQLVKLPLPTIATRLTDALKERTGDVKIEVVRPALQEVVGQQEALNSLREREERFRSQLTQLGVPDFACEDAVRPELPPIKEWRESHPTLAKMSNSQLESLAKNCNERATALETLGQALDKLEGSIAAARRQAVSDEASLANSKAKAEKKAAALRIAAAAYANAVKDADRSSDKDRADAKEKALADLKAAVTALDDLDNAFGDRFITQQRVDEVQSLLDKVGDGGPPDADASKVEVAVVLLPTIADDIRAVAAARRGTTLVPLLIKRDIERARLEAAETEVQVQERKAELSRRVLDSTLDEAELLLAALNEWAGFDKSQAVRVASAPPRSRSTSSTGATQELRLADEWASLSNQEKRALLTSMGNYLDAIGRQSALTTRLSRLRIALGHEQGLAYSEINAGMWSSLIGASVNQAAGYSAGGLKASDFEGILNTIGLLWIGYGTNR